MTQDIVVVNHEAANYSYNSDKIGIHSSKEIAVAIAGYSGIACTSFSNRTFTSIKAFFEWIGTPEPLADKDDARTYIPGTVIDDGGSRKFANIKNSVIVVGDVDNKDMPYVSMDEVKETAKVLGIVCYIYPSHNHKKPNKQGDTPDRFRVVIPLATEYPLETVQQRNKLPAFVSVILKALGIANYDTKSENYGQAYYFASYPVGTETRHGEYLNPNGRLLDWHDYTEQAEAEYQRRLILRRFSATGDGDTTGKHSARASREVIYEGFNLRVADRLYGTTWDFPAMLAVSENEDAQNAVGDTLVSNENAFCLVPCPYEDEHSTEDPAPSRTVLFVPDGAGSKWGVHCLGGACGERDRFDYLVKMLDDGWLTLEQLQDTAFGGGTIDAVGEAEKLTKNSTPNDIERVLKIALATNDAKTMMQVKKLLKATGYSSDDINMLIEEIIHKATEPARIAKQKEIEEEAAKGYVRLQEINEHFAVVRQTNKRCIMDTSNGKIDYISAGDFKLDMQNERIVVRTSNGGGIAVPAADAWLAWPDRREYSGIVFKPATPGSEPEIRPGEYNLFEGFGVVPKNGEWSLLKQHIFENVCSGNTQHFNYFMAWMADIIQRPARKTGVAVVLYSKEQGTGKSIVGECLRRVVGKHSAFISDHSHLTGKFNGHFEKCIFLQADEVYWGGYKSDDGVLKTLISGTTLRIEHKFLGSYEVDNFTRILFTTNKEYAVPIEKHDRRYFVLEVSAAHTNDHVYFKALMEQMEAGGYEAMLFDLLHHDCSAVNLRLAPKTAAHAAQMEQNLPKIDRFMLELARSGEVTSFDADKVCLGETKPKRVKKADLYAAYKDFRTDGVDKTLAPNWFGRKLCEDYGIKETREFGTNERFYEMPSLVDLRQHLKKMFGELDVAPMVEEFVRERAGDTKKAMLHLVEGGG